MSERINRPLTSSPADRVRVAQGALLGRDAAHLLDRVQDVVCETTRAQMLRALSATTLNVTELSRVVGRTKWTTSRHLRLLRANRLVTARRRGRQVFYALANGPAVDAALGALEIFERRARRRR
jgi:ArsR family transcriptional regulator